MSKKSKGVAKDRYTNLELEPGERLYQPVMTDQNRAEKYTRNGREDMMLSWIDQKRDVEKLIKLVESLQSGKQDVMGALQDLAPEMLIELASIATDPKEASKIRLAAVTDWLDRAGFGKVNKHAIGPIDANTPRQAIMALIAGKSKEIEIVDDEDDTEDSY
jgi:hypothetical protein